MSDVQLSVPSTAQDRVAAAPTVEPNPPTSRWTMVRRNRWLIIGVLVFVAGFFVPRILDDPFRVGVAADGLLLGMVALAIGFLIHKSGLVSLGHAAFFGGAAYVVAIGTNKWGWHPGLAVAVAIAATTLFALLAGALIVRVPGISFAVLTLAIGQALYVLSVQTEMRPWTGGFDGLAVRYDGTILGYGPGEFGDPVTFWPIAWIALSVACLALWLASRSSWGLTLEAIRENEERARFCGFSTYLPRLAAIVLSGCIASIAGALFALHTAFVAPDSLHWTSSANALVAAIVGGVGLIVGPPVGALLYVFARDRFAASGELSLCTGVALVIVLVLAPSGIAGTFGNSVRRAVSAVEAIGPMTLSTTAVTVRYGALIAVDDVDFAVDTGSIHGVIGPNGAGKSTFIDALSGRVRPTSGRIEHDGQDITRRPPAWRRRHGIARSFQRTSIFPSLTVGQQLELVASRTNEPDLGEVIEALSLREHLASACEVISYGDQRRVDVALAMLGRPKVLLLDEPAAGLSTEDTDALIDHVRELARHRALSVVLVEHDVDAVFRVCDEITVLDLGSVLARGTAAEIRADRKVIDAYLGTTAGAPA